VIGVIVKAHFFQVGRHHQFCDKYYICVPNRIADSMRLHRTQNSHLKVAKILFMLLGLAAVACDRGDETPKLIITSFSPSQATKDTEVIIQGDNFSPTKGNNSVKINGIPLTVIDASKTTLKVTIPSGLYQSRALRRVALLLK
jgi:hypothetical protein